jgi:hypothetical protein
MEMKSMNKDKQHREDTKYVQWEDGMYVMLDDLECDYEKALVEDSLRGSVYFESLGPPSIYDNSMGIFADDADYWFWHGGQGDIKLTRAQALYIATGDVNI